MFQLDSSLIQVGFGEKAFQLVSTKDPRDLIDVLSGKEPPGWADDLIRATSSLQRKLQTEGIMVPDNILFVSAPQLPPYGFRIVLGIGSEDYDIRQCGYLDAMEKPLRSFYIPGLTKELVRNQLNIAVGLVCQKKFQAAMELFLKVYYWASQTEYQEARIISLLNITGICLLNNQLDAAQTAASQAQVLVEKNNFYDPYLKFYTHEAAGNVQALSENYTESAKLFDQAFQDIEPSGETNYMISALHNEAVVLMRSGEYKRCTFILDTAVSYIESSEQEETGTMIRLYRMRALIADYTINELRRKLTALEQKNEQLSRSFLSKIVHSLITISSKCGAELICMYAGALLSGDTHNSYTVNQSNVNSHGLVIGDVHINE